MKKSATTLPLPQRLFLLILLLPLLTLLADAHPSGASAADGAVHKAVARRGAAGLRGAAQAAASDSIIYSTPYLQVDPHAKDYHIPINIESKPGTTPCDPSQLVIEIRFLAASFYPRSVTRGTIKKNSVTGDMRTVEISFAGTAPVTNGVLTELVGDVLLGQSESTPLTLLSVKCGGVQVSDSVRSGDFIMVGGYCEEGGDRLLEYSAGFGITKIVPNPAGSLVTIGVRTVELDETSLEIYSSHGARVFSTSWIPASAEELDEMKEITLPGDLPNGVYEVVLRSPARRDAKTLIIAK